MLEDEIDTGKAELKKLTLERQKT